MQVNKHQRSDCLINVIHLVFLVITNGVYPVIIYS